MRLADVSIRRPVTTTMAIAGLVVFGLISYTKLGLDLLPNIDFPIATITTIYPGADPGTVEEKISKPLEDAVSQVSGIKTLRSVSLENVSQVILVFDLDKDINIAVQEVRDKVSAALRTLPPDVEPPQVEKMDLGALPILTLAVSADEGVPYGVLAEYADGRVKEQLRGIEGVGGIDLIGYRDRVIWVRADPEKLSRYNLTMMEVIQALKAQNLDIPAGAVPEPGRQISVKLQGMTTTLEELRRVMVMNFMGAVVRLGDVATVEDGFEEETSRSQVNGRAALTIVIRKQAGTNTVEMVHRVKAELDAIRALAPPGVRLEVVSDQSLFVESSVEDSLFDLLLGGILAVVVILVFLRNLRMTFIAAVAIPTSVIGTFAVMRSLGFTLNFVTLMGLSLSVGLLVDDAIVVLENIFRHVEHGESRREAASRATEEIGLAVTATTFSLVAVFVPIATTGGIVGRFLKEFGLTVATAVLISLVISFTLTPMLSARLVKAPKGNFVTRAVEWVLRKTEAGYAFVVRGAVRHRFLVVVLALGILGATGYLAGMVDQEMIPEVDQGQFQITIETPPGSSLGHTQEVTDDVLAVLRDTPGIRYVLANIGGGADRRIERASVSVMLEDRSERTYGQLELESALRRRFEGYTRAKISVETPSLVQISGASAALIQMNVRGPLLDESVRIADGIVARMRAAGGYTDIDTTHRTGKPELGFVPDRERAYALGVPVAYVGQVLRMAIAGDKVSEFREGGEMHDIRLRISEEGRGDPETLLGLDVRSPSGQMVSLRNVTRVAEGTGPLSIDRQAGQRQVTILANLQDKPLGVAIDELREFARAETHQPGYGTDFSGQAEAMEESFQLLFEALALAILFIYLILAAQFESFIHPFTIMLSLPLSLVGAIGALLITGNSLSMLAMIGFIMLMGLVTKNAILLVDFAIQGQRRGLSINDAVVEAGRIRLRPILMTTAAMVFGMLPIALGTSRGAEMRAPMAIAVIGGVLTSTLLTLVVVPVVFSLVEGAKRRLGFRGARVAADASQAPEVQQ